MPIELFVEASRTLNVNPEGQSMPVEVRVYLLRDRQRFDGLEFEALWRDGNRILGPDLASSTDLLVAPGELKIRPLKIPPQVGYVALVGLFRSPHPSSWRYVSDVREHVRRCVPESLHAPVHVMLHESTITAHPDGGRQSEPQ